MSYFDDFFVILPCSLDTVVGQKFPGTPLQRCVTHLKRNMFAKVHHGDKALVTASRMLCSEPTFNTRTEFLIRFTSHTSCRHGYRRHDETFPLFDVPANRKRRMGGAPNPDVVLGR
ncbi:MAG TPA: hypothetical protein DCG33_09145 [Prevotellaceae bacterium]|nr:hypothetical protein [Prevotellaceae bacterium]